VASGDYGFFWPMKIQVNGEAKDVSDGISIGQLLEEMQIRPGRVVVELNRDIVPRETLSQTELAPGDTLEIVHFVGGG